MLTPRFDGSGLTDRLQLLTAVVSCFLYAFQCTPAEHAFNPAVPGTCSQSVALADVDFGIFSGGKLILVPSHWMDQY